MALTSGPRRGNLATSGGTSTSIEEAELLRRAEIATACFHHKVVDIQSTLINAGVSGSEGAGIAQAYAISILRRPDEYREKLRAFIKPGVTRRSFVDAVVDLEADEDEAIVTNGAIVGHEGIYPRREEKS